MLYYVETGMGCGIKCAADEDDARAKTLREVGTMVGVEEVREATAADINWVKKMGGYVPRDTKYPITMNCNDAKHGLKVKTTELRDTGGMFVAAKHLLCRTAGISGTVQAYVPGHGGDVWFVSHDGTDDVGAYAYNEFEPVDCRKELIEELVSAADYLLTSYPKKLEQMVKRYPAGTCNAEDALGEFAKDDASRRRSIRLLLKKAR